MLSSTRSLHSLLAFDAGEKRALILYMNDKKMFGLRGDAWALAWIFGGLALATTGLGLFLRPKKLDEQLVLITMILFFAIPFAVSVWWVVKTKVVVDDNGLTYCDWREKVQLRWGDIGDYYFKKRDKFSVAHFEAQGRVFVLNHMLAQNDVLQQTIREKATASRAKTWELHGTRTFDEWPRVFRYKDGNGFLLVLAAIGITTLLLALQLSKAATNGGFSSIWQNIALLMNGFSIPLRIAFILTLLFSCGAMPFLIVATRWPQIKAGRAYLQQMVSADLRGLTFQSPQEHTPIAWDRVLDYYLDPVAGTLQNADRCVVVTERGEWTFLSTIVEGYTLREIIKTYATNAKPKDWAYKPGYDRDNLKTPGQFQAKAGTKVFHFRTRTARAILLLFTIVIAFVPVSVLFGGKFKTNADFFGLAVFLFPIAVGVVTGWLGYFKTHFVLDERGIATRGWRKSRFIAWTEIESYQAGSDGYFLEIRTAQKTIRFLRMFSDMSDFKHEVQNRAINRANREWKQTQ